LKPLGCLLPLSIPYGAVVGVRNRLYDLGVLKTGRVDAQVVSIGNLSVGGTGKTPFVMHLTERLKRLAGARKVKLGVLSRGYKGSAAGRLLVSDGRRQLADFMTAGDEPVLIAQHAPDVVVLIDRDRLRGAEHAVADLRVKLLLLDDGFQHRRLHRDLDIVLLDAEDPLGNRLLLPAGYLREPVRSLQRADIVVLSKASGGSDELSRRAEKLQEIIKKPVLVTRMVPKFWRRLNQSELYAPDEIAGKRTTAFAGIAKPVSFFNTVRDLGADLVETLPMSDHCPYKKRHLDYISSHFMRSKSEWMVTTAKDAVKLPPILRFLPVYYLETDMEVVFGEGVLDQALLKVIDTAV